MLGKHLWSISLRVLLALGLLFCIYLITTRAVAHWYFFQLPPEGLYKAIAWDPGNPMHYSALGRFLQQSSQETNPEEVIQLFETATKLSPHQARYWAELGGAFEWAGREEEALRAFERARDLFPNSPQFNWQLGNFYLREGELEQAFQAFQKTLLGDPALRRQVFDLAWRATEDAPFTLEHLIPRNAETLFQYLYYLCATQRIDEAEQAWDHLVKQDLPFEPNAAFYYLDILINAKRVEALVAAWDVVTEKIPSQTRPRRLDDLNLVTNGDFEGTILNGGLAWRVSPIEGVVVRVDDLASFDGIHSLRIEFDRNHNVNYFHVFHYVPVEPNTSYRFLGYMRTKDITTDMGPHFEILDAYDANKLFVETESVLGTSSWKPHRLEFRTGPKTNLLVIRIVRHPSRKFDNQIAGTLWLDRFSLRAIE